VPDRKKTLSVIVPALNEEANVEDAVGEIHRGVVGHFEDYEILLFDDGSTDRTGALMDGIAARDPRVRVTHHASPKNLGGVYKAGVAMARGEYCVMIPGDNENPARAMQEPYAAVGRAEIVVPYSVGGERPWPRDAVSNAYVALMNALFRLDLRYYNGTVIHRTANVRAITITTDSFAYQTEALVKLLRMGKSFVEVPVAVEPKGGRESKAFRAKNVYGVLAAIGRLALEVHGREALRRSSPEA
jgi:glycosyltransferase involved in cell wall biosynthesis